MPPTSYEVWAETHEGNEFRLRAGFSSRDAAEDHPVKLSLWKRVWVQPSAAPVREPAPTSQIEPATLRRPWVREDGANGRFTYIRDADGRRILSMHGSVEQRDRLFAILREAGLCQAESQADAAD